MLDSSFPLAICFTHGSVYMSVLLSQFIPPSPFPYPCIHTASPSGLGLPKIYLDVFKYLPGISSKGKKINLSLVFSSFEQERSVFVLPAASILYPSCPEVNLSWRLAIMGRDGSFFLPQESRLNALSPRGLVPSLVK